MRHSFPMDTDQSHVRDALQQLGKGLQQKGPMYETGSQKASPCAFAMVGLTEGLRALFWAW